MSSSDTCKICTDKELAKQYEKLMRKYIAEKNNVDHDQIEIGYAGGDKFRRILKTTKFTKATKKNKKRRLIRANIGGTPSSSTSQDKKKSSCCASQIIEYVSKQLKWGEPLKTLSLPPSVSPSAKESPSSNSPSSKKYSIKDDFHDAFDEDGKFKYKENKKEYYFEPYEINDKTMVRGKYVHNMPPNIPFVSEYEEIGEKLRNPHLLTKEDFEKDGKLKALKAYKLELPNQKYNYSQYQPPYQHPQQHPHQYQQYYQLQHQPQNQYQQHYQLQHPHMYGRGGLFVSSKFTNPTKPTKATKAAKPAKASKPTKAAKLTKPTKPTKAAKAANAANAKKPKTIKIRKPTKTLKTKKSAPRKNI